MGDDCVTKKIIFKNILVPDGESMMVLFIFGRVGRWRRQPERDPWEEHQRRSDWNEDNSDPFAETLIFSKTNYLTL